MSKTLQAIQIAYHRNNQELFSHLDIVLNPGQGLLVHGPNGSGKTTLLRILASLMMPTQGKIHWQGKCIYKSRATFQQDLHYLGHHNGIINYLTVGENILYSAQLAGCTMLKNTDEVLEKIGLSRQRNVLAQHLSAGQKRRLALAKLLILPKALWILDEPFTHLDQTNLQFFNRLIEQHLQQQGIAIIASHQAMQIESLFVIRMGDEND